MIDLDFNNIPDGFWSYYKPYQNIDNEVLKGIMDYEIEYGFDTIAISENYAISLIYATECIENDTSSNNINFPIKQFILFEREYAKYCINMTKYVKDNNDYDIILFKLKQNLRLLLGYMEKVELILYKYKEKTVSDNKFILYIDNFEIYYYNLERLNNLLKFLSSDNVYNNYYIQNYFNSTAILKYFYNYSNNSDIEELKVLLKNILNCITLLNKAYKDIYYNNIKIYNTYLAMYTQNPIKLNIVLNKQIKGLSNNNFNWYLSMYNEDTGSWENTNFGGWTYDIVNCYKSFVDKLFSDYMKFMHKDS